MQNLKISLIQSDIEWEDIYQNIKNFDGLIDKFDKDRDLIVLPEMFSTGFTMNVEKCAQTIDGPAVQWMKKKAEEKNAVISGSVLINDNDKFYNRMIWMKPDGSSEIYDKRHLFRMGKEHEIMSQGLSPKIVELHGWKFNLQICYDLRFPVWSKNRFRNNIHDYDVLIYVANWPEIRSFAYRSLLVARAIENQAFVIWVNRIGEDGNGIAHSGNTMIIDPAGKIIKESQACENDILSIDLLYEDLLEIRSKFKVGLDWDEYNVNVRKND